MAVRTGPVAGPELPIALERDSGVPLREQLARELRERIRSGRLPKDARLPGSRPLAAELGVARNVVVDAYAQLIAEGYLSTTQGAPTRVALAIAHTPRRRAVSSIPAQLAYDFHPGLPDLGAFPHDRWLRSLRAAVRAAPLSAMGYGDPRGMPSLRESLGSYLGRVRGAIADPERIIVCSGFVQGFALVCRVLRARGIRRVAMEDPGWIVHRTIARHAGLAPVPIPVDTDGMLIEGIERARVGAVLLTPAHQFPTGVVLGAARRHELLAWARRQHGLFIEDDYDAEYRYDRDPMTALQGLAAEHVIYIGSASKRLAPGLKLGWVIVPSTLTDALTHEKALDDGGGEAIGQLTLANFITSGELDRHLHRMRLRYRKRRDALLDAVRQWLPDATVDNTAAGLYALVRLPPDTDESALISAAGHRQVGVTGLYWHHFQPDSAPPGLLLGFANLPEPAIARGIQLIGEALAETRPASNHPAPT